MNKLKTFFKVMLSVLIFLILADIFFKWKGHGYNNEFKESQFERYPFPYDMFRAKPNVSDHNSYGFRGPVVDDYKNKHILKIAFFGGSTGFYGNPPIPELLKVQLEKKGYKNIVFNFSSVSSSHSQHVHRLVEFLETKFDLIIFYGGGNETLNYYYYDSRPGYPYNFFIRNELSPFVHTLIRYSSFFGKYDKVTGGSLSGYKKMIENREKNYPEWTDLISKNYFNKLKIAQTISTNAAKPEICNSTIFVPITQPINLEFNLNREDYKPHYKKLLLLVNKVRSRDKIDGLKNYLNYSDLSKQIIFTDALHTSQSSKSIIAKKMTENIEKILKKECFN